MIRGVVTAVAMAAVATANDAETSSLLQLNHFAESDGARIWEATRKARDGQDVCLPVSRGQRAPIAGTFKVGNELSDVHPGEVAPRAGMFCVPKNTIALLQRSLGLSSAKHMDRVLTAKEEKSCQQQIDEMEYDPHGVDLLQVRRTDPTAEMIEQLTAFATAEVQKLLASLGQSEVDQLTSVLNKTYAAIAADLPAAVNAVYAAEECVIKEVTPTEAPPTPAPTPAPAPGKPLFCHTVRYHTDCKGTEDLLAVLHTGDQLKQCSTCQDIHLACGWGTEAPTEAPTMAPTEAPTVEETTEGKR